ncbi:transmembrane 9 superfamily member 7-like isoform X2 [Gossypium hirsutum]|uniref:Transmembrane 9 superfamily member n=1 Tax=Gossypium hirsutum TaxID=3635 RepID=A0ABM3BQY5_GOSHI|nr:transmembrane 9 superfamily member 7-like isoform X2 [Gossypium hirsutum]
MGTKRKTLFFAFFLLLSSAHSFYLPGVAPRDFQRGDPLYVKVNKLSSSKTQLPYDYYFLNYCKPPKIVNNAENLGEVLRGDRIENSVYTVRICDLLWCCFLVADKYLTKSFLVCRPYG